jgi:hypothetical protein
LVFFFKDYFFKREVFSLKRSVSFFIKGFLLYNIPVVGDVLTVFFSKRGSFFFFEGLCYSIKRKSFLLPDSSFSLVNKIKNSVVCYFFSFFYNILFLLSFLFLKRRKDHVELLKFIMLLSIINFL